MSRMIAGFIAAASIAGAANAREEPFDPFAVAKIERRSAATIPLGGTFQDEAGHRITLRQLGGGRPIILAPVQHNCRNICGLTLEGLGEALAGQSYRTGRDFTVVAFGIDPRETAVDANRSAARLKAIANATGGVHALVGAREQIEQVTSALGYRYRWDPRTGQFAHVAAVAVLTADGKLARWIYGVAPSAGEVHLALTQAKQGRMGAIGEQVLLLCFHYDPVTGKYDRLARSLLQWGGGVTAAGMAAAIGLDLLRVRRRRRRGLG